jgi:hypothetical protein
MIEGKNKDCKEPKIVKKFRNFDIWFDPTKDVYYTSHCEHTKRSRNIEDIKKWLDKEKR